MRGAPWYPALMMLQVLHAVASAQGVHADQPLSRDQLLAALAATPSGTAPALSAKNLSNQDLSGIDFRRANLSASVLNGARLTGATLDGCNLTVSFFEGATLSKASLQGATLFSVQMKGAILTEANLSGARLIGDLRDTDLSRATLTRMNAAADMKNQSMGLMRAVLRSAMLDGADFSDANLSRTMLEFAKLRGARLEGANLFAAELGGADLTGADIAGVDFTAARVMSTVLRGLVGKDRALNFDKASHLDRAYLD
jgi:uncharacterized protein YjbI with pentapeptide repeats